MASAFQANAFQASPAFQIEGGAPALQGPRGAWISDERVERARRKRWKEQQEEAEVFRLDLIDILHGRPPRSTLAPVIVLGLPQLPPIDPALLALRGEVAALERSLALQPRVNELMAEAEDWADEEAGIVALLMATDG